jgi:type II secretory pathway pseudopilin PulG
MARQADAEAGYALTDALVAVLILATVLILSLVALGQARAAADVAWEARQARVLLDNLLQTGPRQDQPLVGRTGAFTWILRTETTGAERPIAICRRSVSLEHAQSGRSYAAATLETCPLSAAGE